MPERKSYAPYKWSETDTNPIRIRSRNLALCYYSFKHPERRQHIDESHKSFRSFVSVARRLIEYEAESHRKISDRNYVKAHVLYYGKACFPNCLLSKWSFALYDVYTRMLSADYVPHDAKKDDVYQEEWLVDIAKARGESVEVVRNSLKDSGLIL